MVDAVIFSKNRAMQLEALLKSMSKHAPYLVPKVIYTHTNDVHRQAYEILQTEYPDAEFIFEDDTRQQILQAIQTLLMCFLCDDDVFFKDIPVEEEIELKEFETLSVRLGEHIKKAHFKYKLSLDGNIFVSKTMKKFLEGFSGLAFLNPNKLESALIGSHNSKMTLKYNEQCLVGIPHNRVSESSGCHFTGKYSEDDLCKLFIDGKRLSFDPKDFEKIPDVHKEIDFIIK